jgi:ferritin-like metal-binding protein YciE
MQLDHLKKLYADQLKDLYSAETQLLKALPKMREKATAEKLAAAFDEHLKETEGHVKRLEQVFEKLDFGPHGEHCDAMEGLIKEGQEIISEDADERVRDAGLIAAAQKVEHYEIAGYGTVRALARVLKDEHGEKLLEQTLAEEKSADEKLTQLAEQWVNQFALQSA